MIARVVLVMICGRCRHVNGLDPGYRPEKGQFLLCRRCRAMHDVLSVDPFSVLLRPPQPVVSDDGGG